MIFFYFKVKSSPVKCIWPIVLLIATCILLLSTSATSYAQHPSWQNFTIEDGLPSNRVYAVHQDRKGFIWFATHQGLCRFNGYEFTSPVDTSGRGDNEVFKIVEDNMGRIWVNYLDATLSYIVDDTLRRWPHNNILDSLYGKFHFTGDFEMETDGTIWIALTNLGFAIVRQDGSYRITPRSDRNSLVATVVNEKALIAIMTKYGAKPYDGVPSEISFVSNNGFQVLNKIHFVPDVTKYPTSPQISRLQNGDIIFSITRHLVFCKIIS